MLLSTSTLTSSSLAFSFSSLEFLSTPPVSFFFSSEFTWEAERWRPVDDPKLLWEKVFISDFSCWCLKTTHVWSRHETYKETALKFCNIPFFHNRKKKKKKKKSSDFEFDKSDTLREPCVSFWFLAWVEQMGSELTIPKRQILDSTGHVRGSRHTATRKVRGGIQSIT